MILVIVNASVNRVRYRYSRFSPYMLALVPFSSICLCFCLVNKWFDGLVVLLLFLFGFVRWRKSKCATKCVGYFSLINMVERSVALMY